MQREVRDLEPVGELEHGEEQPELRVFARRGEGEAVAGVVAAVAEEDRLHRHAREEGSDLEGDERMAVGLLSTQDENAGR